MKSLIVLFRLRSDADRASYEHWARNTDLPIVRNLSSVKSFDLYRVAGLFGSGDEPPYDYVEVIGISDTDRFGAEVGGETMRRVAAEFREFADNPVFLLGEPVEGPES